MGLMLYMGSTLSTAWTGRTPDEQLLELATRFALPLTLLSYPANLLWIAYCRTVFDRRSFASLGLRARRVFPDLGRGAIAGALCIGVLWSILWLTGAISVVGWSPEAFEMNGGHIALNLLGYAVAFAAVGFFEETLFRGYALHNFSTWLGWSGAVAAQAIIFALVHLGNVVNASRPERLAAIGALPSLVLIAVFFALCYRKTGSLWFPIGFHFAWNFCLGCLFSLPVSGIATFRLLDVQANQNSWLSGGKFGAEGSWLLIPILGLLIYYISRSPDHPQAVLDLGLLENAPVTATAPATPVVEADDGDEETDESRENRFRTKFGSAQGFSADTLRELRELQEQREAAARDAAVAAARQEAVSSFGVAPAAPAEPATALPPLEVAPAVAATSVAAPASVEVTQPTISEAQLESERPLPTPAAAPQPTAPKVAAPAPNPNPAPTPDKKKPPSPRW